MAERRGQAGIVEQAHRPRLGKVHHHRAGGIGPAQERDDAVGTGVGGLEHALVAVDAQDGIGILSSLEVSSVLPSASDTWARLPVIRSSSSPSSMK